MNTFVLGFLLGVFLTLLVVNPKVRSIVGSLILSIYHRFFPVPIPLDFPTRIGLDDFGKYSAELIRLSFKDITEQKLFSTCYFHSVKEVEGLVVYFFKAKEIQDGLNKWEVLEILQKRAEMILTTHLQDMEYDMSAINTEEFVLAKLHPSVTGFKVGFALNNRGKENISLNREKLYKLYLDEQDGKMEKEKSLEDKWGSHDE